MASGPEAGQSGFLTPERFAQEQAQRIESPRGRLLIASCRSGAYLARQVAQRYQELSAQAGSAGEILYLEAIDYQFSDSETCVRLARDVSGDDVFLFQAPYDPTSPRQVDENYMAFLIAARTFREWGANHVTGVTPYLAYARQDKPTQFRWEPTTAKLMADLTVEAGVDRLVTWHPHSAQINGFYEAIPVDTLEAVDLFVETFESFRNREEVIVVAPDAGAAKFTTYFGQSLQLRSAIAMKYRPRPEEAQVSDIIGDFKGKKVALVLDDMISSGGTIYALVKKLVEEKRIEAVYLGVSHNLCLEQARGRLLELRDCYHLQEMVITDSIPQSAEFRNLPFVSVRGLADTLSRVINRIHYNRSVTEGYDQAPMS